MKRMYHLCTSACLAFVFTVMSLTTAQDVTIWSISVEQNDLYKKLEAEFNARYPQWTINFQTFSQANFRQNLPLSFESGDAPDMILAGLDSPLFDLLANDWLAPVAGGAEIPNEWYARFPEATFLNGHNMVDGVVYGVPINEQDIWGPGYLYYNRTVLNDAGIDPDTEIPTTWSELLAVCERLKAVNYPCFTASFASTPDFRRWWIPITSAAQSWTPLNYQTGTFAYADESRLRAWELLKTLYNGEHFIPGVETTDRETSRQIFALDQAAFYLDGAWMPSVFRTGMGFADLDFGVAAIPMPGDGVQGALHKGLLASRLHVTSAVRNPEAAWAVVDFLTEPDGPYAQGYIGGGFGFLSFANNLALVDSEDQLLQDLIKISQGYRKAEPAPLLACADMENSTAYAEALRDPTVPEEESSLVEALVTGQDWTVVAARMASERQAIFEILLANERDNGLDVSLDYFTYPNWAFDTDFDFSLYPLCGD